MDTSNLEHQLVTPPLSGPARDGLGVTLAQTSGQTTPATPPTNGPTNPAVLPADRVDPGDGSLLVRILTYLGFGRRATRNRKSFVSMLWNLFWGFSQVFIWKVDFCHCGLPCEIA